MTCELAAEAARPERTGGKLLELARRRELDAASVTVAEEASLRAYARRQTEKLQAAVCNPLQNAATCPGWRKKARNKFHLMLRKPSARLHALYLAEKNLPKSARMSIAERLALLPQVDAFQKARPITYAKRKRPGSCETREITKFEVLDRARQTLLRLALDPFARACPERSCDPSQALTFGGLPTACEALRAALAQAPTCAWFLHLDVRSYYDSISVGVLGEITGLQPELIHSQIAPRSRTGRRKSNPLLPDILMQIPEADPRTEEHVAIPGADLSANTGGSAARSDWRRLPQGSAVSPSVAEMVMGHILRDVGALEGVLWSAVYSDNIGVLAPSREAAVAVKHHLTRVFRDHKSGPYHLTQTLEPVGTSFRFLGYRWSRAADGSPEAKPGRLAQWESAFDLELLRVQDSEDVLKAVRLLRSVRSYAAAFKLWTGEDRELWVACREYEALVVLDNLCDDQGIDPPDVLRPSEVLKLAPARDAHSAEQARRRLEAGLTNSE